MSEKRATETGAIRPIKKRDPVIKNILRKSPKKIVILLVIMYFKKIHSEEISFPRRSSQKRLILRNIKQQKHCTYFRKQTSVFRLQHHYTLGYLRKKGSIL